MPPERTGSEPWRGKTAEDQTRNQRGHEQPQQGLGGDEQIAVEACREQCPLADRAQGMEAEERDSAKLVAVPSTRAIPWGSST